ncbi:MAG: family 16 glycosylhydrolase [Prolixibacteraceae bacterium]
MKKIVIKIFSVIFLLNLVSIVKAQSKNSTNQTESFLTNGVIAHRGAWKKENLPQNSIASLKQAIQIGAAGSEFDVQLTADGVLVVNHDPDYADMKIEKTDFASLEKVPLKNGETLPTLENYLKTGMTQQKTKLILELKPSTEGKDRSILLAQNAVEKVKQMHAQDWIVYISFDYDIVEKIHQLDQSAKTMYLGGNKSPEELKADGIWGADYNQKVFEKEPNWIREARQNKIATNVWTVDDFAKMDYFLSQDIDFITTDEPEVLLNKVSGKNVQGWNLVWSDEFNYTGLPDSAKWNYDTRGNSYGWGNNEAEWYTVARKENTWVGDGTLKIIARNEPTSGKKYSSGRLTTKGKGDWKYGKVEVRAKLPSGNGTWPAIWMLSSDNKYGGWPESGEIDIMEQVGSNPDTVLSTVHTGKYNHIKKTQRGKRMGLPTATTDFHVYTLEWEENELRSFVDGKLYFTFDNEKTGFEAWPFDQPFHVILNLAIGGGLGGQHGIDNSLFPHTLEIDYVRVYQK